MPNVNVQWWAPDRSAAEDDDLILEGSVMAQLEVEREDADEISLHTYVNGHGSKSSYHLTREQAIALAYELLKESQLR